MRYVATTLRATALALPLSLAAAAMAQAADVVETIRSSPQHQTLAQALEQAGMIETLRGEGPFTVFAPTDTAFAAVPEATMSSLLAPENRETLRTLLGYHIVEGEAITAAELPAEVETASGTLYVTQTDSGPTLASTPREAFGLVQDPETTAADELQDEAPQAQQEAAEAMAATGTTGQDAASGLLESVTGLFGAQPEEGARVAEAGLEADNGVIHVIDYVLVPAAVVEEMAR
jgi:uncharacterized surface protein with fasciclin (FAS1) repeats